jgi:hypothetical protein
MNSNFVKKPTPNLSMDVMSEKAGLLSQKEIISSKGVQTLISYASKNPNKQATENLVILEFLMFAFYDEKVWRAGNGRRTERKIKPEDVPITHYWALPLRGQGVHPHLIHEKRSTNGRTRTRTLTELKDLALMSEETFDEAKQRLKESTIVDEGSLVHFIFEREGEMVGPNFGITASPPSRATFEEVSLRGKHSGSKK